MSSFSTAIASPWPFRSRHIFPRVLLPLPNGSLGVFVGVTTVGKRSPVWNIPHENRLGLGMKGASIKSSVKKQRSVFIFTSLCSAMNQGRGVKDGTWTPTCRSRKSTTYQRSQWLHLSEGRDSRPARAMGPSNFYTLMKLRRFFFFCFCLSWRDTSKCRRERSAEQHRPTFHVLLGHLK